MLRIIAIACFGVLIGFGSMAYAYHGEGMGSSGNEGRSADCLNAANCPRYQNTADTPATQPDTCPGGGCGQGHRHGHGGHHGH